VLVHDRFNHSARLRHFAPGIGMQLNSAPLECDLSDIFQAETLAVDQQRIHIQISSQVDDTDFKI
jgi:hypothetical protein